MDRRKRSSLSTIHVSEPISCKVVSHLTWISLWPESQDPAADQLQEVTLFSILHRWENAPTNNTSHVNLWHENHGVQFIENHVYKSHHINKIFYLETYGSTNCVFKQLEHLFVTIRTPESFDLSWCFNSSEPATRRSKLRIWSIL